MCCFLEQETFTSQKVLVIPRNSWLRLNMTEKLFTGTLNYNKNKNKKKVAKRNATKTPLKPPLRISIFQLSPGNRLLRIEQSGVASSTKVPPNSKKRESVKLKGSVKKGKQEPKNHHQSQQSEFTCSICNRQFRAKIGLYSHQRTHQQT